jgi:hypothetical protein
MQYKRFSNEGRWRRAILPAVVLAGALALSPLAGLAQSGAQPPAGTAAPGKTTPYRFQPSRFSQRAQMYYGAYWGVDSLSVKAVESGELIRFSYRVLDAGKAGVLNNKKSEPSLLDPQARVKLVIPSLEKVGQLRQSQTPEAGKSYWMAFSNKGRLVKPGDRVDVIIGTFRAEGLIVE